MSRQNEPEEPFEDNDIWVVENTTLPDDTQSSVSKLNIKDQMAARHHIEERLEDKELDKEINEYEHFDLDDDTLH